MTFRATRLALAVASAFAVSASFSIPATAQTAVTKEQIAEILRQNPEMVLDALRAAQAKEQAAENERLAASMKPVAEKVIGGDPQVAFIGNPNGVPVVEFFDYNCGFCKRFHAETAQPLMAEGNVKLILVQTPILGEGSHRLAEFAAAAHLQGKFGAAHSFLITKSAKDASEANALIPELVQAAGLDKAKFDKALADGSATQRVAYNSDLSIKAGVSGTPMIFANNQAIPGAIPLDALKQVLGHE